MKFDHVGRDAAGNLWLHTESKCWGEDEAVRALNSYEAMQEALRMAVDHFESFPEDVEAGHSCYEACYAALKLAEGEE